MSGNDILWLHELTKEAEEKIRITKRNIEKHSKNEELANIYNKDLNKYKAEVNAYKQELAGYGIIIKQTGELHAY